MNAPSDPSRSSAHPRRRLVVAWLALLLLLAASAGTARLHLGIGNLVASLGIAALKTAIVAWVFMELRAAPALFRVVALVGAAALAVMLSLGLVDLLSRRDEPSAWQTPQQVAPTLSQMHRPPATRPDRAAAAASSSHAGAAR